MPIPTHYITLREAVDAMQSALDSIGVVVDRHLLHRLASMFVRCATVNQFISLCTLMKVPEGLCIYVAGYMIGWLAGKCYTYQTCDIPIPHFDVV